jgi:hypothetical protein
MQVQTLELNTVQLNPLHHHTRIKTYDAMVPESPHSHTPHPVHPHAHNNMNNGHNNNHQEETAAESLSSLQVLIFLTCLRTSLFNTLFLESYIY